jgi:hypothetical protein
VPQTTLLRLVKTEVEEGGVFEPEDIAIMTTAFDSLLADFKLAKRDAPAVTMLAKLVIELCEMASAIPSECVSSSLIRFAR